MASHPLAASPRIPRAVVILYLLQLLILEIASNHHLEHDKQLAIGDEAITVNVVDLEGEPELLLLVALAGKGAQPGHEFLKIHISATILVEDCNHPTRDKHVVSEQAREEGEPGSQRIRRDLWETEKFLSFNSARVVLHDEPSSRIYRSDKSHLIQLHKPLSQTIHLLAVNYAIVSLY
jgi:hypothetical protein